MKKLAEHLENLNMIKESSWEKKWIRAREAAGAPPPTIEEYKQVYEKLNNPPFPRSTFKGEQITRDD